MTRDPLTEALDALRVLGDPARAWGVPPSKGMVEFANAAHARIRALKDAPAMCATCGENPAEVSGRCLRCEASMAEEREML